jgi:hypothetical protein
MRAALAVLALLLAPGLALALPAPGIATLPPWLAPGDAAPFHTVQCPLLPPASDPARPLEVCNVRATAHVGPANEIDLALDPKDAQHMVVVAKGYNPTRLLQSSFTGGVITPYATSFDGGRTWTEGYLQPMTPTITLPNGLELGETSNHESDPVVEFAPDGSVLVFTLRVNHGGGIPVYRSTDGGRTFAEFSKAFEGGTDKEWFVTDPTTGSIYGGTLLSNGIGFVKSTDGGATWSAARKVLGGAYVSLDVGPRGQLYMVSNGGSTVHFTRSLDGGATFSASRDIGPEDGGSTYCDLRLFRTPDFAQLAASRTTDDLYVVVVLPGGTLPSLSGCGPAQDWGIYVLHSPDGGVSWGAPVRVDDGLPAFRFMPEVAVSPKGDVHVAWLDQRDDPTGETAEAFYAHSADGLRWDANLKVSDVPFPTSLSRHQDYTVGIFVGDYMGLSATDDRAVLAFPDTRYGEADIFVATIR